MSRASTRRARRGRRLSTVMAAFVLAGAILGAAPAVAQADNPGVDASHYLTQITGIAPATAVTAEVDPRGQWIQLTNPTGQLLTVLGYSNEPYVQISNAGVSVNLNSPSRLLNGNQVGSTAFNPATAALAPSWQQLSGHDNYRWHDHRIHWMGFQRPPSVQQNPKLQQVIDTWTIHLRYGSQPVVLTGTLSWIPVSGGSTWLTNAVSVAIPVGALGVVIIVSTRRRRRRLHDEIAPASEVAQPARSSP